MTSGSAFFSSPSGMIGDSHHPVGTEFRVDVSLDGRGDRLGAARGQSKTSSSVIAFVVVSLFLPQIRYTTFPLDGFTTQHTPPSQTQSTKRSPSLARG